MLQKSQKINSVSLHAIFSLYWR